MMPKGTLLIIGGAEDKGIDESAEMEGRVSGFEHYEILKNLLPEGKYNKRIEVITTASKIPDVMEKVYKKTFNKIGYKNIGFISIRERTESRNEKYYKRLKAASAVFFSGGDQFRLSTILGGTEIVEIIREKYEKDKNFIVAGTSSGAMAMSRVMISEGQLEEALIYKDLKTTSGLGFLESSIIDTHFIKRSRFGRLAHAIIINPGQLGIGLGEDAALIIKHGTEAECRGSGMVVIIDGKDITHTNIADVEEGEAVFVENLRVHLLVKGCRFSLKTRKLETPKIIFHKKINSIDHGR
jgi:cyanophycinase